MVDKQRREVPIELWNNIGVLKHELGDPNGAEEAFRRALGPVFGTPDQYLPQYVTITYNLARLYEDLHQFKKAEALYKGILKEHPAYLDCYVRLGKMSLNQGEIHEASEWYKEILAISPHDAGAWTLLANLHLEQGELHPAQKKFERLLAQDRHDEYALLQLANIFLIAARHVDPKTTDKEAQNKRAKYLNIAQDYFTKLLTRSPHNIYAANGLGIVCAERGFWGVAHDFFQTIREQLTSKKKHKNAFDFPDAHLNLAHVYLHTGHYGHAITLVDILLFTSHSHTFIFFSLSHTLSHIHSFSLSHLLSLILLQRRSLSHQHNLFFFRLV
jgi:RNA polymerase-associated protein CTR9